MGFCFLYHNNIVSFAYNESLKKMNNEIVTDSFSKKYVTGNWESTFISLMNIPEINRLRPTGPSQYKACWSGNSPAVESIPALLLGSNIKTCPARKLFLFTSLNSSVVKIIKTVQ